jgi:hypothetical protein
MIAYHTDGDLILQQAFQMKAVKHHISTIMAWFAAHGFLVDLNIKDNEASADIKQVIIESWKTKFQLVPLDMHRRNKAKQMIQHFKTTSSPLLLVSTPRFHHTSGVSSYPRLN